MLIVLVSEIASFLVSNCRQYLFQFTTKVKIYLVPEGTGRHIDTGQGA